MQLMMMMMVGELAMSYCNPIGCHGRTCFETGTTIIEELIYVQAIYSWGVAFTKCLFIS